MAALRDIARDVADVIREGIGWVIVYRAGRSWRSTTIFSDIGAGEWETDDLDDALAILKVDPEAVLLNGYYCGHFGEDMTVTEIAVGIRWHYERGYCRLVDKDAVYKAREDVEAARAEAAACGLPFCDRLVDGAEDYFDPYVYDGSMTLEDYKIVRGGGKRETGEIRQGVTDGPSAQARRETAGDDGGQVGGRAAGGCGVCSGAGGPVRRGNHVAGCGARVYGHGGPLVPAGDSGRVGAGLYPWGGESQNAGKGACKALPAY